jgi:hypothetical protein
MTVRHVSKEFQIQTIGVDGRREPYGEITSPSDLSRDYQQPNLMIVERARSTRLVRPSAAEPLHRGDGWPCTVSGDLANAGIVIFERDNLLLQRSMPPRDFTLLDLDQAFVKMLSLLRRENVVFGFLSDQRGMDASSYGWHAYLRLIEVLDTLLGIQVAMPDFWITTGDGFRRPGPHRSFPDPVLGHRNLQTLLKFLRVDDRCIAAPLYISGSVVNADAANQTGFASIRYDRGQSMQMAIGDDRDIVPFEEAGDPAQLYMLIKDKLSLAKQAPVRQWAR